MSTNEFPMNDRNVNGAVSVIRSISKWPPGAVKTINDKLGETLPKSDDLRLIRRVNLENLNINAHRTNYLLHIQAQKHKKENEAMEGFYKFCQEEFPVILDEYYKYLDRKAAARSNSAPPDYSKTFLMRRDRFKY